MASIEIRKRKDGTKMYRVKYYEGGLQKRTPLMYDKNKAIQEKQNIEKAINLQKSIQQANVTSPLLAQLGFQPLVNLSLQEFYSIYEKKRRELVNNKTLSLYTLNRQLYSLHLLNNMFPNVTMNGLTSQHLEHYLSDRAKHISAAGANKDFANLKTVLNFAFKWGFVQSKFWEKVEEYKVREKLPSFYTREEIERIEQFVTPELSLFAFRLIKFTGIRRSGATRLKWQDFKDDFKIIHLKQTKTREERFVPVHEKLYPYIVERYGRMRPAPNDLLIPYHPDTLTDHFNRAMELAGCKKEGAAVHVLRHSLGAYLTEIDTPLHVIAQILGHKTLDMAKRYSQLSIKKQANTINQLY